MSLNLLLEMLIGSGGSVRFCLQGQPAQYAADREVV
nr:hypothetical protein [Oceanimonas marisflavi]